MKSIQSEASSNQMEPMEGVKMEEIEKDQAVEEEIALINNMGAANKGFGNPTTRTALDNLIKSQNPNVIFLCETKNDSTKMSQYLRRFNYPNSWIFPPVYLSGGICLLSKSGFNLEIVDNSDKMINAIISYDRSKPEFLVTFLYGSVYHDEKLQQCDYISRIGKQANLPWVLIGDLNITMFSHERSTFTNPTTEDFPIIQHIIDNSDLPDLGFVVPVSLGLIDNLVMTILELYWLGNW
ncbi:hypothetical protein C5167_049428 [Papaver somniferum]|uniref:Rhodanese domain-containing protein n=1 Tax=Papaver somniferum TaxID=3469 RepID=A0A4Y7KKT7_PAPSO|nr:hypothetical protein C5167_049428 [Papaver somniferum]